MKIAYNTNGWRGRPIEATIGALAAFNYDAIELGVQHDHIPPESWTPMEARRLKGLVAAAGMTISNLHAGAKDLLGPDAHEPSLISLEAPDRARRVALNKRAIDFAAELGTDLVCITSGVLPLASSVGDAWQRLTDGVDECLVHAAERGIRLALEPELFIKATFEFLDLHRRVSSAGFLGLNLDIGHAQCLYEDIPAVIRELAPLLWHVHVEDISRRVHKHLVPGQGQVDLHGIGRALADIGYAGAASVELMDHGADAPAIAQHCMSVLRTWRRSIRAA